MRRFDKKNNIKKANLLAEQRYLESKGLVNESEELTEEDRTSMSEFFGDTTDNVDTLLKMFSKYQPEKGWMMTVGYVNNANLGVRIKPESLPELEKIARELGNPAFIDMVDSDAWKTGLEKGKNVNSPFARQKPRGGDEIPAKVYTTKKFMLQWKNTNIKPEKDAAVKAVYDKHGLDWEEGEIDKDDKRGMGWEPIQGTPFNQHQNTGTQALTYYSKQEISKGMGQTKYFLNFQDDITELCKEEVNFIHSLSPKSSGGSKIPAKLAHLPVEAAQEIKAIENLYQFKRLDLSKIMFINCSMVVDGENKKFSYINYDVAPKGLNPGDFREFIEASIK